MARRAKRSHKMPCLKPRSHTARRAGEYCTSDAMWADHELKTCSDATEQELAWSQWDLLGLMKVGLNAWQKRWTVFFLTWLTQFTSDRWMPIRIAWRRSHARAVALTLLRRCLAKILFPRWFGKMAVQVYESIWRALFQNALNPFSKIFQNEVFLLSIYF